MSAETLARIQFAFTIGYHFIYVPMSIGLAVTMVIAEGRYYRSGLEADKAASTFWIKLFTTTFAVGVATGLTMEFAFGTNWAGYSRFVGDIFGAPLAADGILAFFLESTFLGVLLFGRRRVRKGFYYASTWLVLIGAHLSALWILIANSWQHTPRGYKIVDGRAVLTDFWAAALNPSTGPRLVHTLAAAWIAGGFAVAGIAAWHLLKRQHLTFARRYLVVGLVVGLVVSAAMPLIGDWHATEVAKEQPIKLAAFEGIYKTQEHAPMTIIGWWDANRKDTVGLKVPGLLSFLAFGSFKDEVKGLDSVPASDRPPVQATFMSYHLMVMLSGYFILLMLGALFFTWRKRIERMRWLLWLLVLSIPLPIVAAELGWMSAEVGRQPWIVQGLLRTKDGISKSVSAGSIATTLTIFAVIYLILFVAWLRFFTGIVRKGPQEEAAPPAPQDAALTDTLAR